MTQNTDPNLTTQATLATLAQEVGTISQRLEAGLRDVGEISKRLGGLIQGQKQAAKAAKDAAKAAEPPARHPLEMAILAALTEAGKAVRKTELAKRFDVEHSSVHYHCKRLVLKREIYSIETQENGRDVDYVILTSLHKVPGIPTAA